MRGVVRPAVTLLLLMSGLLGLAYPGLVTVVAQASMPGRARGSLVRVRGRAVGSALVGQPFSEPADFWGRPSATSPRPCDATASGGSNLGPSNPALLAEVRARVEALRAADPGNRAHVPVDLVTASASGLDPHISPAAARYQVPRVARARHLAEADVQRLVDAHVEGRDLGFLGEPRVDVLRLNLALDRLARQGAQSSAGSPID